MEPCNTFTSIEKLKLTKEIDLLFSTGRWLRSEHIRLVYLLTDEVSIAPCQVLFSAAKKTHRRAVKRNLLKRRMRESYRINKNSFYSDMLTVEGKLLLGFIYTADEIIDYNQISREIKKLMAQVASRVSRNSFLT